VRTCLSKAWIQVLSLWLMVSLLTAVWLGHVLEEALAAGSAAPAGAGR